MTHKERAARLLRALQGPGVTYPHIDTVTDALDAAVAEAVAKAREEERKRLCHCNCHDAGWRDAHGKAEDPTCDVCDEKLEEETEALTVRAMAIHWQKAQAEERERCAKVADTHEREVRSEPEDDIEAATFANGWAFGAKQIGDAIRALADAPAAPSGGGRESRAGAGADAGSPPDRRTPPEATSDPSPDPYCMPDADGYIACPHCRTGRRRP